MTKIDLKKYIKDVKDFPKKGILFRDISPMLASPEALEYATEEFSKFLINGETKIVGADARGFLFGIPLSIKTKLPFIMARKAGKLPGEVIGYKYELEYGESEIQIIKDSINPNDKVVIIDDLLATGGTANAIVRLVESLGAKVTQVLFVIEIEELNGKENISVPYKSLIKF